ncbi:MAG: hypothetical protein HRU71_01655 [Planctomycetia bacterium]|nr:MAG: hypothetical protein HRU71_01655 [Planctomycetia bacterium]
MFANQPGSAIDGPPDGGLRIGIPNLDKKALGGTKRYFQAATAIPSVARIRFVVQENMCSFDQGLESTQGQSNSPRERITQVGGFDRLGDFEGHPHRSSP